MNYVALSLLALTLGADAPQGYQALKSRSLKIDLDVDPQQQSKVSHVELFVSRDRGGVWESVATAKPDQKYIPFAAKEDGLYWLSMVVVFKDGKQEPPNVAAVPPAQKLLIDATPPVLKLRDARRDGEEVAVEWSVEDAYPCDERTKVEWRQAGGSDVSWKTVPVNGSDRRSTRFNPANALALQVRVTVEDQAGNSASQVLDLGGQGGTTPDTTAMKPSLVPPPTLPSVAPVEPGAKTTVPVAAPAVVDLTPKPAVGTPTTVATSPAPLATSATVASAPALDLPQAQVVNFVKFDLPYQIEAGASGISRVDLYCTRDDGQTWIKWSEHDGHEAPLKVALDRRYNPQPEGTYGFRLVAVSGAGLSDAPPVRGTVPEFRVQVDLTPPIIKIFQPEADANQRDVLILKWEATDKNFGKEPIAIEWSESTSGPWKTVIGSDSVLPVAAGIGGTTAIRIANSGSYGWKLPTNLPSHKVYLKITAWDLAGNKSEVATPAPILVDLVKPKARIQGIMPAKQ